MENVVYNNAVNCIREFSQNKLSQLEQEFKKNRAEHIKSFNDELFEGVNKDSPVYNLATLVAQSVTIGLDIDEYPAYNIDITLTKVLQAALNAGILYKSEGYVNIGKIKFYGDFSGIYAGASKRSADYVSWDNLNTYKSKQTWNKL